MVELDVSPNFKIRRDLAGSHGQDVALRQLINLFDSKVFTLEQAIGTGASTEKPFIDPHDAPFNAKGDAVSLLRATVATDKLHVSDSQYQFKAEDVGKTIYVENGWQDNAAKRTIVAVANGVAELDTAVPSSGTKTVLFGTDDTAAIQAALDAAAKTMLDVQQMGMGADPASWGGIPAAGIVRLRGGRGYIISNSQTRYDAGNIAALNIPRHVGLVGCGMGQTCIYIAPGTVGHGIANWGARETALAADERITLGNFSIFGMRGLQGVQALDCIYYATSMGGFTNVDNYSFFFNMQIYQARRHGMYVKGRGECLFQNIWTLNNECAGFYIDKIQDSRFITCNAGGNGWAGFHIQEAPSCAFSTCKSFYNGAGGAADPVKCCNWYLGNGSQYRVGSAIFTNCEAQESRGSGWVVDGGLYQFAGCLSSDPKRFGSGTKPVSAGLHIRGAASNCVFSGFYVRASLGLDWSSTTENHYGGDYAVYIERNSQAESNSNYGPRNNRGTIYTLTPSRYDVAKLGGPGITNRLNGDLSIDGVFLPSDWPSAPTITSVVYGPSSEAQVTYTAPASTGGRAIRDYIVQYRVSGSTEWQEYTDPMSDALSLNILGLTNSTAYEIRVAAVNGNGRGAWSNVFAYTHTPTAPYAPAAPTVTAGSSQVRVAWVAPVTGGSPITDYVVQYKLSSDTSWTTFSDGVSTTTNAVVTGLSNDLSYDFRVAAVNAVGQGSYSPVTSAVPRALLATVYDATLLQYNDIRIQDSIVSANGTSIETWQDLSGQGNHDTQTTEANKPSKGVQSVNSVGAVSFDGTNDNLSHSANIVSMLPDGDFTMFWVFKLDPERLNEVNGLLSSNNDSVLCYIRGDIDDIIVKCGSGNGAQIAWVPDTNTHVLVARRSGATLSVYLDGIKGATVDTASSAATPTSLRVGWVNTYYGYLDGCLAAQAFYDSALSISRINAVGADLATGHAAQTWTNAVN